MYMQYLEMLRERLVSWQEVDWKTRCELKALKHGESFEKYAFNSTFKPFKNKGSSF